MGLNRLWINVALCKQHHSFQFAVCALKLAKHFSDGYACIPPGESGHVQYLELVGHVFIQHAEARALDVLVRLPFVLRACKHGIGSLDLGRECKLRVYRHVAWVNRGKKWSRLEESVYHR